MEVDGNFARLVESAGLRVPDEELPKLREQYERLRRHLEILSEAEADIESLEPGFRFDPSGA